jgi:hypothetical protein
LPAEVVAWVESLPWRLPPSTRIREEGRWVLESLRTSPVPTEGSADPELGLRRLALAFVTKHVSDLHSALENFCSYADQVRGADPDLRVGRAVLQWMTTAPETLKHVVVPCLVIASKVIEEQELAASVVARKRVEELELLRSACRRAREELTDVEQDDGAGGADFMSGVMDRLRRRVEGAAGVSLEEFELVVPFWLAGPHPVVAAMAGSRRSLLGLLIAIEDESSKAIDAIRKSFRTIDIGVGESRRPQHVGQQERLQWLAGEGIPQAVIGSFEDGMTEEAVKSMLKRIRRAQREEGEQPPASPGADRPPSSR